MPEGPRDWGSSRIRIWWLADAWDRAEVVSTDSEGALDFSDVSAVVTQHKALRKPWDKLYAACKERHVPLIADICDPMWWFLPESRPLYDLVDFAVCSSARLVDRVREELNLPAICIPDRHDPSAFVVKEEYETDCPVLMWHGTVLNRASLWNCAVELHKLFVAGHKFKLVIVDNGPKERCPQLHMVPEMPVEYLGWETLKGEPWDVDAFYREILPTADVGLVPPFPGTWGDLKSSNKETCFWMAGIPTCTGMNYAELVELVTNSRLRKELGERVRKAALRAWTIERSVEEWDRLMRTLAPSW